MQSSALAIVLLAARMGFTRRLEYGFLVWNLFLAWVPLVCAIALRALHLRRARETERGLDSGAGPKGRESVPTIALIPFFAVWLAFLPNAPYMVTDFVHLRYRNGAPLWFDAVMLASYAWSGVGLGVASLRICSEVVRDRRGPWTAAAFVGAAGLLTGFGIYLGRFVRLNTWDVLTRPLTVITQALSPIVDPLAHPRAWVVTLTFGLFFLAAYGVKVNVSSVRASSRTSS